MSREKPYLVFNMNQMLKTKAGLSELKVMSGGVEIKSDFEFKPRRRKPLMKRLGVGVNDAPYCVNYVSETGKKLVCPIFTRWSMMMARAYCPKYHARFPSYIGCSVDPRWHSFMDFRDWLQQKDWVGRELDKDLIQAGNKVYSPETCMLIPGAINTLLTDSAGSRGDLPLGVSISGGSSKFVSRIRKYNKRIIIGYFSNVEDASKAYKEAKIEHIASLLPSLTGEDPRLIPALERIIVDMRADLLFSCVS